MNIQKEFEILVLLKSLLNNWIKILFITLLFFFFSIFYSLNIPNTYKASAVVVPNPDSFRDDSNNFSLSSNPLLKAFSPSGINSETSKTQIGYEILTSRDFLQSFISDRKILPNLIAVRNWDIKKDLPEYDNEIYNSKTKNFLIEKVKGKPLKEEGYKVFKDNLTIGKDGDKSALFSITFVSQSPSYSKKIVDWLIEDINKYLSLRDKKKAEEMIESLNNELSNIKDIVTREAIYALSAKETRKRSLSKIGEDYFLMTIDKAFVPYERFSPKRTNLVIIYTLFGFFLSCLFFISIEMIKIFIKEKKFKL